MAFTIHAALHAPEWRNDSRESKGQIFQEVYVMHCQIFYALCCVGVWFSLLHCGLIHVSKVNVAEKHSPILLQITLSFRSVAICCSLHLPIHEHSGA